MPYKNKEKRKEYAKLWVRKRRESFFLGKKCIKCGVKNELELDHINPKNKISHRIWSWSEKRRNKEISKCQILCKKCHLNKTCLENYNHKSFVHGTKTMYNLHGCRCELCKKNDSIRRFKRRQLKKLNL